MERPYICGGNKYTISPTNTIGMPVSISGLPSEADVEGVKLFLKSSFHVSLVCINEIIKKHNISNSAFRDTVLNDFCEFTSQNPIELIKYTNEFKYSWENELKTIIVLCEVSHLKEFFKQINNKFNLNVEYPPTHVTLYAHDGKTGIFLTDSNDIRNLTKSIPNPIGRNL